MTAVCSVCGNIKISKRSNVPKNKSKWRCYTKAKERDKVQKATRRGLTLEQYEQMRKVKLCEICEKTVENNGRALAIDHCHNSGKIRGILCTECNLGLGHFHDNSMLLKKAVSYLKKKG